jgi:hypothetical protein
MWVFHLSSKKSARTSTVGFGMNRMPHAKGGFIVALLLGLTEFHIDRHAYKWKAKLGSPIDDDCGPMMLLTVRMIS